MSQPAVSRRPLVAGNWKMNLTHLEAIALVQRLGTSLSRRDLAALEVVVLPPFVDLRSVQTLIDSDRLAIGWGAQDLSVHDEGAYTGEVSGRMLAALGCRYVLVGHSERRAHHGETDDVVRRKVLAAARNALVPLLCVGEGPQVREAGHHVEHCVRQLDGALDGVPAEVVRDLVVAYEPLWAIGTGAVATPADAQEVCSGLRRRLVERYPGLGAGVRLLYGGSVKPDNVADLMAQPDVDGALVGGASLIAPDFAEICRSAG